MQLAIWAAKLFPIVLGLLDQIIQIRKATEADYPEIWKDVVQPGYVDASDAFAKKMAQDV